MNDDLALTRSRAKHPSAKTVAEAQKVKSKVTNSDKKRRQNMTEWHRQRLAEMDREIAAENATKENTTKEDTMNMTERLDRFERKLDADEQRLSAERDQRIADEIDAKAQSLMGSDPTLDYSQAFRLATAQDGRFAAPSDDEDHGDLANAVERKMAADPENYRADEDDEDEPVGSVLAMSDADYQEQAREAVARKMAADPKGYANG